MNISTGYAGKMLDIDLSRGRIVQAPIEAEMAARYLGGKGFGAKILSDQLPPGCPPLSPENILVFATGPLTGTLGSLQRAVRSLHQEPGHGPVGGRQLRRFFSGPSSSSPATT